MGKGHDNGPVVDVSHTPDVPPPRVDVHHQRPRSPYGPAAGNAVASHEAMNPTAGIDINEAVTVTAPLLAGMKPTKDDRDQTWYLHSKIVGSPIPISAYAIPRARLTLDKAGTQPAAAPTPTQPEVAAGSIVYGPDHLPLVVLGSDAANVIVKSSKAIHFAVGAGSCVLVRTEAGWYLFDAGINQSEPHTLAEAIARAVMKEVGHEPIRAAFLTHGHYDHIAMLKFLARYVQIDAIVANPRQLLREVWIKVREAMRLADLERRKEKAQKLHDDTAARDEFEKKLDTTGSKDSVNEVDRETAWKKEVERRIDAEFPELREAAAIPIKGTNRFDTMETKGLHGKTKESVNVEDLLPSSDQMDVRGVVHPDVRSKPHVPPEPHEEDRMSTTLILRIGERRLIMMPDLRRTDLEFIKAELKAALGTRDVDFQEWQLGHHSQSGFEEGPVSAKTLMETLEVIHGFRAKGTKGAPGRDVVIGSVDAAQVSPAQIRMLRLIGFKTYLAKSQTDVHTYDILSGGKMMRAVRGPLAPEAMGEATLQRSIAGRQMLSKQKEQLTFERDRLSGKGSRAPRKELAGKIAAKQKEIDDITALEHAVIEAAHADPFDDAKLTEAEGKLNKALDSANVGKVVTSDSTLTDTALVLLREPLEGKPGEGTAEAAQRAKDMALRDQKSRVDLLRERLDDVKPEGRQEAYAELYAEMISYQAELTKLVAEHGPGVTQHVANAELERIKAERAALEKAFETRTEAVRLPDGHLAENKIVKITPPAESGPPRGPSKTAQAMMAGLEVTGRVMGGVMVISTITGTKELMERYESGEANLAQLGIGGTREFTSGIVSLKMLRGKPVGSGVFVLISALEIGEALAGDYDSETQRRRAVDSAVRNAAINTACMYIGEALIATANPIGIAAGAIIMFLGPAIIGKLFDDTPETLYPDVVTETGKTLAKLLAEYKVVIGGLELQKRDPKARAAIGLTADIRQQTKDSILTHRMRALYLEQQLVAGFWAAYKETKEGRAGLREIDEMRRQFLALRAEASTDESDEEARKAINDLSRPDPEHIPPNFWIPPEVDAAGRVIPIREITLRNLRDMERNLAFDKATADEIRNMDQWSSIKKSALDLSTQVLRTQALDPDWADIGQRQHDLEARVQSARYRLNPAAQAEDRHNPARDVPLLAEGSDARRVYEEKLKEAETFVRGVEGLIVRSHFLNLRHEHVETPNIEALWKGAHFANPLDAQIALADDSLDLYQRTIELIGGPPALVYGGVEALYREPVSRSLYRLALQQDRKYRKSLERLQVNEVAAQSLLQSLASTIATDNPSRGKVDKLRERFLTLQNDRKERRGILYSYELEALDEREKQRAIAYFTPLLGGSQNDPALTTEEIAAAERGDYGETGAKLLRERRTIVERLAQIKILRIPVDSIDARDASGKPTRGRTLSGIMLLDAPTAKHRMLVGIVDWNALPTMARIVPLDDTAAVALGGYGQTVVMQSRLTIATEDDLEP